MIGDGKSDGHILLSIIIVNYNGKHFLKDCIESIEKYVNVSHEIIIVDNASTDGSQAYIRDEFSSVFFIESDENLGFTGGNNLGAEHAVGKHLLLLNNDTVLCEAIKPLVDLIEKDSTIGVVGCRLHYGDGRLQESIGYEHTPLRLALSWTGLPLFRRVVRSEDRAYNESFLVVEWVSGACLMTPRHVWKSLSGLDDQYFMYVEDVDYCRRVNMKGLRVIYTDAVHLIHYEGGGREWIGQRALLNTVRSYMLYTNKFHGPFFCWIMRSLLSVIFLMRVFYFEFSFRIKSKEVMKEKALAYYLAVRKLITKDLRRV